jgi:hypothetical protein
MGFISRRAKALAMPTSRSLRSGDLSHFSHLAKPMNFPSVVQVGFGLYLDPLNKVHGLHFASPHESWALALFPSPSPISGSGDALRLGALACVKLLSEDLEALHLLAVGSVHCSKAPSKFL